MSITVPLEGFGGGASLNFDVKAYATETALLAATPKKNTIGIIPEIPMTGWIIDANQPEDLTEGMVWITTGTSSTVEFNALKKNTLQVYPLSAKQYVDGAWVNVTAMSYQGGRWNDLGIYLYNAGNEYTDLTGGWSTFRHSTQTYNASACSKDGGKLTLKMTGTSCAVAYGTEEMVDLTDCSAIEFTTETIDTECAFAVSTMRSTNSAQSAAAQVVPTAAGVILLDVSELRGKYYVWFGDYTANGKAYGAVVTKIRLLK